MTRAAVAAVIAAGTRAYRIGKYDEALAQFNAALKAEPETAAAWVGITRVYLSQKKVDAAESAAKKALEVSPEFGPSHVAMGEVYFRQGMLAEAERQFQIPLHTMDPDPRAYYGLSRVYNATLNYKMQKDALDRAHKLDPNDPQIRRAWLATLPLEERREALKEYLAVETNDNAEEREWLEHALVIMQDEIARSGKSCRLTSKVSSTNLPLQTLYYGASPRIRGNALSVKINGVNSNLLLDTGSSEILVDKKIAEKAGIKSVVERTYHGVGDQKGTSGYLGFADHITIGELQFENCYVDVANRNDVSGENGVIGADVFSNYLVDIDFPRNQFHLTQLPPLPEQADTEVTLQTGAPSVIHWHDRYIPPEFRQYTAIFRFGPHLMVPTRINDSEPRLFLLDSGSFTDVLSPRAAKEFTKTYPDAQSRVEGMSGRVKKGWRAHEVTLRFAGLEQLRDTVVFDISNVSNGLGTEVSGLLGFNMLKMLDVKIDYRDGLVHFDYNPSLIH